MTVAVLVALLLSMPAAVLAQTATDPSGTPILPAPSDAAVPVGPLTPAPPSSTIRSSPTVVVPPPTPATARPPRRLDLRPSVRLTEEWTDNFLRSQSERRSNLRSTIAPGARLTIDDPTLTGHAIYTPEAFHDTYREDFGLHHALAAQLGWQATPRFKLTSDAAFIHADDPARADRLELRRGREEFTRISGGLRADYSLPLTTVGAHYRASRFDAEDDRTTSHTLGASASRTIARTNTVSAGYEYLDTTSDRDRGRALITPGTGTESTTQGHEITASIAREFTFERTGGITGAYAFREQSGLFRDSSYSRWSVAVFNNYVLPGTISLQGNIGVAQILPSSGDAQFFVTSDSALSYYLGPAILGLAMERGFSETFRDGQDFGVVETFGVTASISYRFTPLVTGSARARYRENESVESVSRFTGKQTTIGVSAELTYQVFSWLTSALVYSYTESSRALDVDRGFTENRVRLTLNAVFD